MQKIPPEQLLMQVNEVLRTMPPADAFIAGKPEIYSWTGHASAISHSWDSVRAILKFDSAIPKLHSRISHLVNAGIGQALTCLHQIRHELGMQTASPLSVNIGTGLVFDYFDEVRKAIETAKQDILFIDPYLDAEFVSKYLPHVTTGVSIRLLGREKINVLLPAVALFKQQSSNAIEVRTASGFHDRYIIVDTSHCYQSGSSFKDGAKKAPTTITEILDAFPAVQSTYETIWTNAVVQQ